jgi:hypothetical protein
VSFTENAADVTSGRIQVGAAPGGSAQVIVPACCAPVAAAGMVPNAPPSDVEGVVLPLDFPLLPLLQAASAVRPATARARAANLMLGRAILLIAVLPLLAIWVIGGAA